MKKYLMTAGAVVVLAVATLAADLPKVPQDVVSQIALAQRDQSAAQRDEARAIAQSTQANQQFQDTQKNLQKQFDDASAKEKDAAAKIAEFTKKALADAKLDPANYDLDLEKLEFVAKKAPAAAPEKK